MLMKIILVFISYIIGSIPSGYFITQKCTGLNIQEHGSGNIGSTNVRRIAGKKASRVTQVLDILKGLIVTSIAIILKKNGVISNDMVLIMALASIIGHNYTVFLRFKGGKGVNTTLGASFLIAPVTVLVSVGVFYAVKKFFKYVSLGSVFIGISLPLVGAMLHGIGSEFYYLLCCGILMIIRHRENIKRLINGKENL